MQTLTLQNLYSKKHIYAQTYFSWRLFFVISTYFIKKEKLFALINIYEVYVSNVSLLSIFAS